MGRLTSVALGYHSSQYNPLLHCHDFLPHSNVNSVNAHSYSEALNILDFDPLNKHYV
jgi:hypothetical protein